MLRETQFNPIVRVPDSAGPPLSTSALARSHHAMPQRRVSRHARYECIRDNISWSAAAMSGAARRALIGCGIVSQARILHPVPPRGNGGSCAEPTRPAPAPRTETAPGRASPRRAGECDAGAPPAESDTRPGAYCLDAWSGRSPPVGVTTFSNSFLPAP